MFSKTLQKIAQQQGLFPQTLVCDTFKLQKFRLFVISTNLQFFENFSSFGSSPDPL